MKIGFIGAGKVGFTLGRYFAEHNQMLTGYYSRQTLHAKEAAKFTNSTCYEDLELLVYDSDAIFITVVDSQITEVFRGLCAYNLKEKFICHCSGAMTAREAFPEIAETGAFGYSIHPLFPISDQLTSYRELADAFFCIEGDAKYLHVWKNLLTELGLHHRTITSECKIRYHAAASIASNLVVALMAEALALLQTCGFEEEEARRALSALAQSNLNHILEEGPIKALTGPVERGDAETVKKHLECLSTEEEQRLYQAAAVILLKVARDKNPNRDYTQMENVLGRKQNHYEKHSFNARSKEGCGGKDYAADML